MSAAHVVATGLAVPEGPIALHDGALLVVEILGGRLTRIEPDGSKHVVAHTGGGPNGAAPGPDGCIYVCNNGGSSSIERDGIRVPIAEAPPDASPGSIQRVDPRTGTVTTLYTEVDGNALRAPNDLVFDAHGGFWFTDYGKVQARARDRGSVCYARADGSTITEVIAPLDSPNGIGLSPDERFLYVAETYTGNILRFGIDTPGCVPTRNRNAACTSRCRSLPRQSCRRRRRQRLRGDRGKRRHHGDRRRRIDGGVHRGSGSAHLEYLLRRRGSVHGVRDVWPGGKCARVALAAPRQGAAPRLTGLSRASRSRPAAAGSSPATGASDCRRRCPRSASRC